MSGDRSASPPFTDLTAAVVVALGMTASVLVPQAWPLVGAVRVAVGLPFLLVVPGYVVITALYPRGVATDSRNHCADGRTGRQPGLGDLERLSLSVAASPAIVGGTALVANFTPWGIRRVPIAVGLAGLSLVGAAVAFRRRRAVPPTERPTVAGVTRTGLGAVRSVGRGESLGNIALNGLVVLSVLIMVGSLGYAATGGPAAEQYSEFAVLTTNDTGSLSATDHPTQLSAGTETPLYVKVTNHEGRPVNYTVVIRLERVSSENGSVAVTESVELDRLHVSLQDESSRTLRHTVSPEMAGEDLRLTYLLFTERGTEELTRTRSREALHIWVDSSGTGSQVPTT